MLNKRFLTRGELDAFWKRYQALEPNNLCRYLYAQEVVRLLRRALKNDAGLSFSEEDILDSIHEIIVTKIDSHKPKLPTNLMAKKRGEIRGLVKPNENTVPAIPPQG